MSKTWTHPELVSRAARWLRNAQGCAIVFTEFQTHSGEIPDAIGWKRNGRSVLIEVKASRADFKVDSKKPWRSPQIAIGAERYYLAPPNIIGINELPADWGLLEVVGNAVKIQIPGRPRKDLRSDAARLYELRALVSMLSRVQKRIEPALLDTWMKFDNRELSAEQIQATAPPDGDLLVAQDGWLPVVTLTDTPNCECHDGLYSWCLKHEMHLDDCGCLTNLHENVEYRTVDGVLYGRPMVPLVAIGN